MIFHKTENGNLVDENNRTIPVENKNYNSIINDSSNTIVEYTTPLPTPLQVRNSELADITYVRPSDSTEIQIRDSQFFPQDEARMTKAINKLEPLGTAPWISKDNQAITVTREDLEAALVYQADEIERIFTDYIATL